MKIICAALLVLFYGISLTAANAVNIPGENISIDIPGGWKEGAVAGASLPAGNTLLYSAMDPRTGSAVLIASEPNNGDVSIYQLDTDANEKRVISDVEVSGASAFLNSRAILNINGVPAYLICFNLESRTSLPAYGRRYILAANKKFYKIVVVSLNGGLDSELKDIAMSFQFTSPPVLPGASPPPAPPASLPGLPQSPAAPTPQAGSSTALPVTAQPSSPPVPPDTSPTGDLVNQAQNYLSVPSNLVLVICALVFVVVLVMVSRSFGGEGGVRSGFLRFVLCYIILCIGGFVLMGVWMVSDGTKDNIVNTDAALVPGYAEIKDGILSPSLTARLEKAASLFNENRFPIIIVSGTTPPGEDDESQAMSRYLQAHSIPVEAIVEDHPAGKTLDSVDSIVKTMQDNKIKSLLLITDYYRMVRLKLDLAHANQKQLASAHVGEWKKDDAMKVVDEDFAIFRDMYNWYILPESKILGKKATEEAGVLKESINSKLSTVNSNVAPQPAPQPTN